MPMNDQGPYEAPYPSSRRLTFDLGKVGLGKQHVKALLEVDVTEARKRIREARHAGARISFFAWLVKVTADCVAAHPEVNGFNDAAHNRVLLFRDVDISIAVEKNIDGARVPLPYVVRRADRKTLTEIHEEIEGAKRQTVEDEGNYVLGEKGSAALMKIFVSLPQWLRLALMQAFFFSNPRRMKNTMGTVMITTVGMAGHARGWIVPFSMHPLCLAFGSLNQQPSVYQGTIQLREILHLTVLVDHDVVDGVPAARFGDDLVKCMERADGLPEQ